MADSTEDSAVLNATFCATLVDEWVRAGLEHAVVSPGSRSTPMAMALADRPEITVHVHIDERSAAFVGLGIGMASGRPAVVLTTSGTAAVELHPAVVEAHQASVPLVAVTADRPPELHDVGAPQTVDQNRLFGPAVRWFVDPGPPSLATSGSWRSLGARAVLEAEGCGGRGPGPVHLNLAFREPLLAQPVSLPPGRPSGRVWHHFSAPEVRGSMDVDTVLDALEVGQPRRVLVVAGARCGNPETVLNTVAEMGWPVLADSRSGCRTGQVGVITTADTWLRLSDLAEELQPDLVVRLGDSPASKVVGAWLAQVAVPQIAVHPHGEWLDPDRNADVVVRADPAQFLATLAGRLGQASDERWSARWQQLEVAAQDVLSHHLESDDRRVTDPAVARAVARSIVGKEDAVLVVSSSMPIRDLEWYGGSTHNVAVMANRGANGIDGVVSTAVGVALARHGNGASTMALVGDLAFVHDTNALVGLSRRQVDLTIVVVDNDGGAIFSFLPPARELTADRFESLFGTPHGADIAGLARSHGIHVTTVEAHHGVGALRRALDANVERGGPNLVVIKTDRAVNAADHDALHRAMHASVF